MGWLVGALLLPAGGFAVADVTQASGVNIHFTDAKPGELEMLKAAGFRHIRMDLTWGSTEKEKGVYDFSAFDRLTAALEKHGLKAYYILDYSNRLYEKEQSVRTPEGRAAFTKWALAAVSHFKGRDVCWEIWNEPNGGFWKPTANVHEYAAMALDASKAIKAAFPEEYLSGPATAGMDFAFLEECFKAGLLEWWDGVTVHPYRHGGPETVEIDYHEARKLIGKYAPQGKKIDLISGEWGYSSVWTGHDADTQGMMLPRQWLINAANGIPISVWYDWHDDGPDPKEAEHNFGTVRHTYHKDRDPVYDPKPSYLSARTFNKVLAGHRFVKRLTLGDSDLYALLFEKDGETVVAAWSSRPVSRKVGLPADDGTFKVVDHLGAQGPDVAASAGRLEFQITEKPVYYVIPGKNAKLSSTPEALRVKLSVVPSSGKEIILKVENLSGRELDSVVSLKGLKGVAVKETTRAVKVPSDQAAVDVSFPLTTPPQEIYEMGASLTVGDAVVSNVEPLAFHPVDESPLEGAKAGGEGDAKVEGVFTLKEEAAPESSPGGAGKVMRLDYRFGDGWKYATVYPGAKGPLLKSRDGSERGRAVFGMWIYGNASGLHPRLRIQDALDRVWQPSGKPVTWKGWNYVQFPLDEGTAHWGGKEDKTFRGPKFPLRYQTVFLFDNGPRLKTEGTVWFTMPVLILE